MTSACEYQAIVGVALLLAHDAILKRDPASIRSGIHGGYMQSGLTDIPILQMTYTTQHLWQLRSDLLLL